MGRAAVRVVSVLPMIRHTWHPGGVFETCRMGGRTHLRTFFGPAGAVDALVQRFSECDNVHVGAARNRTTDGKITRDVLVAAA